MREEHRSLEMTKSRDTAERRQAFRVAIFGTGGDETKPDQQAVEHAKVLAGKIIEDGFSISTGGQDSGVMKAATEVAVAKAKERGRHPSDLVKGFPLTKTYGKMPAVAEAGLTFSTTLLTRLRHLIDESSAFVVLGGKTGTVVELITALHSENVQRLSKQKPARRPLLIVDPSMEHLDTLNLLVGRDEKLRQRETLQDIYYFAGQPGWEEQANKILELYYRQSLGQNLDEQEQAMLEQASYEHNLSTEPAILKEAGFHL